MPISGGFSQKSLFFRYLNLYWFRFNLPVFSGYLNLLFFLVFWPTYCLHYCVFCSWLSACTDPKQACYVNGDNLISLLIMFIVHWSTQSSLILPETNNLAPTIYNQKWTDLFSKVHGIMRCHHCRITCTQLNYLRFSSIDLRYQSWE